MPKSGNTFLSEAIARLPGFKRVYLVPDHDRREQELSRSITAWWAEQDTNWVAPQHTRMSLVTAKLLSEFNIRPIFLVRNLFDVVPSLLDHHRKEGTIYPMAYAPDEIVDWSFDRAAMFVAKMVMPWYFNFYVSWQSYSDKLMVRYEDFIATPERTLSRIADFAGFEASEEEIGFALVSGAQASPRRNTVVGGRGGSLPPEVRQVIEDMATFYPEVDFSPVGLSQSKVSG